jgi:tetratricopeptide (TPR) repeat protein
LTFTFRDQGRLSDAERVGREALSIFNEIGDSTSNRYASILAGLGHVCYARFDYEAADSLYRRLLKVWSVLEGSESLRAGYANISLGNSARALDDLDRAEKRYLRALELIKQNDGVSNTYYGSTLLSMGNLRRKQGRYDEARKYFLEALDNRINAFGQHHRQTAAAYFSLARIEYLDNNISQAKTYAEKSLAIEDSIFGANSLRYSHSVKYLAAIEQSLGNSDKSFEYFARDTRARNMYYGDAFKYSSENQKLRYISDGLSPMSPFLVSYADTERSQKALYLALEATLRSKGLALEALADERSKAFCSSDDELHSIVDLHTEICSEISGLTLANQQRSPQGTSRKLQSLYHRKDSLEIEMSQRCSELGELFQREEVSVKAVASRLSQNSTLVEYLKFSEYDFTAIAENRERGERYFAFVLEPDGSTHLLNLGAASHIDSLATNCQIELQTAATVIYTVDEQTAVTRLASVTSELYNTIFGPIKDLLRERNHVIVSPDGALSLIPFETLTSTKDRYLIEDYQFTYLSSGRELLQNSSGPDLSSNDAVILVNPDFENQTPR